MASYKAKDGVCGLYRLYGARVESDGDGQNLISISVFYTPRSNARIRKNFHISQSPRLAGEIGLCERTSYSGSRRELFIISRGCLTILHHTCTRSRSRSREPPTCTAFRSHIMDLKSQGWCWTTCRSRDWTPHPLHCHGSRAQTVHKGPGDAGENGV